MSYDLIEKLAAAYPKAFFPNQADRRPLKLGIHHDLNSDKGHGLTGAEVRQAVGWYCQSLGYLAAMTLGAPRIDLNGMPAGRVTAEGVDAAVKAAGLSQKMRRERCEAKAEKKAVAAAVAREQQTEKAVVPMRQDKNDNVAKRLSLADLRVAARQRQAIKQRIV
jgi:ProP effector